MPDTETFGQKLTLKIITAIVAPIVVGLVIFFATRVPTEGSGGGTTGGTNTDGTTGGTTNGETTGGTTTGGTTGGTTTGGTTGGTTDVEATDVEARSQTVISEREFAERKEEEIKSSLDNLPNDFNDLLNRLDERDEMLKQSAEIFTQDPTDWNSYEWILTGLGTRKEETVVSELFWQRGSPKILRFDIEEVHILIRDEGGLPLILDSKVFEGGTGLETSYSVELRFGHRRYKRQNDKVVDVFAIYLISEEDTESTPSVMIFSTRTFSTRT